MQLNTKKEISDWTLESVQHDKNYFILKNNNVIIKKIKKKLSF